MKKGRREAKKYEEDEKEVLDDQENNNDEDDVNRRIRVIMVLSHILISLSLFISPSACLNQSLEFKRNKSVC